MTVLAEPEGDILRMNVGIVCSVNGDQSFLFLDLGTYQNAFLEYCAYSSQKKEKNKISIQV